MLSLSFISSIVGISELFSIIKPPELIFSNIFFTKIKIDLIENSLVFLSISISLFKLSFKVLINELI